MKLLEDILKWLPSYGANGDVWKKLYKELSSEIKKRGAIIFVRDKSSWPNTYSFKVAEDIPYGY